MKTWLIIATLILLSFHLFGQNKLGLFDNHLDIGPTDKEGFASFNEKDQTYMISVSGVKQRDDLDNFHFLWTTIQGDFILRAEVQFIGKETAPEGKVGWIVKNNLNGQTECVKVSLNEDGLTSLQYREKPGYEIQEIKSTDWKPDVIQLERKGNKYIMSTAKFGEEFISLALDNMEMDNEVYVGLYVSSYNPDMMKTVLFRNVRIVKPADEHFTPYQDYIGSHLEVLDIDSGHRKVLHSTSHSIQAPNWTTDGEKMIYNSKGRLYEYEVESGKIKPLETGFATNNNNDHVLNFRGDKMGISHHNRAEDWESTIYYLPTTGSSKPIRVTKPGAGASYLHGWSPDEKSMIFTGERNGQFDVYSVDVSTGDETQLTNLKTLDDGSEYSPDGKYIFFNSARSGKMQLWRMDVDGKNQRQITFDRYNDWFPHISPNSKWIVFISFHEEIDPEDHPFYQHCLIRVMPYEGGEPKVIGYIYGGQGSLNVPSWSPDSKKIAFISNTKIR